jgi:Trk K+ transport system NAD-binding subunit
MDTQNKYIVIGSTRTGITLTKKLSALSIPVLLIDSKECPDRAVKNIYYRVDIIEDAVMLNGKCYFVTFDEDSANIKLCLAINKMRNNAKIYTMLRQESLGDKLALCLPNFHYINLAKQAEIQFIKVALDNLEHDYGRGFKWSKVVIKLDSLVKKALSFILAIMATSTLFFHFYDSLPWIDAFYFTVTMMATVGFGDYSLKDHSDLSKLVGSFIMLLSITGTAIIFALVSDSIIRRRKELAIGIFRYKGHGHILVIGGGSVGFNIVKLLLDMNEKPVMLDKTLDGQYSQQIVDLGVPYLVGNAKDESNLYRAGLNCCKVIICVTRDDLTNLEVSLNARIARPNLPVILRIYDQNLAANLHDSVAIKHSLSMSFIAADEFIKLSNAENTIKSP